MSTLSHALFASLMAFALAAGMLAAFELGVRLGTRRRAKSAEAASVSTVDGAVFGLLGLLIAFSFSGALTRFDARRALIVEEANAIGTAYLRLDVLPAETQPALREQFRRYVEGRLEIYRLLPDMDAAEAGLARSTALQGEIWRAAVAATAEAQQARILVLPALNQMIDITTTRTMAAQTHPPAVVFGMLVVSALVSSVLAGDAMSATKKRSWLHMLSFALATGFVMYVILDLEYPRLGLIQVSDFDRVLEAVRAGMD